MRISILTLFPQMFTGPFTESILKRAQEKGKVEIELVNIRDFGIGSHQMVDDTPYGGGIGMVLRVDVVHQALEHAIKNLPGENIKRKVLLTAAGGKTYKQKTAKEYSLLDHLIIICGHYEGVDDRIMKYVDEEISIGDFVLTGGEIPAMLITDSVVRLIEGVITEGATDDESFSQEGQIMLEYPHFTKPRSYDDQDVPEVLLQGDHQKIAQWRHDRAMEKTKKFRPDLLKEETNS
jgi:tRNA (guanine37-N1)-methyltransferase